MVGCLGVVAVSCLAGIAAAVFVGRAASFGMGREVASTAVMPGVPFVLTYTQRSRNEGRVWLDLDVGWSNTLQLTGPLSLRASGTPIASYNLDIHGASCEHPVRETHTAFCTNWNSSQTNGQSSLSGNTRLFTIPTQSTGTVVTVTGMIFAGPGVQARRLRVFASE